MAKCNFCEAGNSNIVVDEMKNSISVQIMYWGNGEVDISGGVLDVDDLLVTKTVKINYCPICGKEL